jgi:predicted ATPase/DNA-binding SARP family transcriptional activator
MGGVREGRDAPGHLRLCLLDGFAVLVDGRAIPDGAWRSRKARQLLKLLALAPDHRLHRDDALEALWPDLTAEGATKALYQVLFHLRRTLDPALPRGAASPHVRLERDRIVLLATGGVETDVADFERATATARVSGGPAAIRTALALGGELLPDDRYEEWTLARRQALRDQRLALLAALAAAQERAGEAEEAAAALQQVLELEPAHEPAHAGLMRLYAAAGRRDEALRQYERLTRALREHVGAGPDAETRRLYQSLLTGTPPSNVPATAGAAGAATAPAAGPPPPHPLAAPGPAQWSSELPRQLTSFVGRDAELADVGRLLRDAHLVTLTGPGGVGKTRLAVEVAGRAAAAWPDGVALADLAPVADPGLVPHAVAAALGLREDPGRPPAATLADALRPKRLLLVLDNCEHLLEACARLADALLRACPHLRLLATSREALGVAGEAPWRVLPLSLPAPDRRPAAGALLESEAVRLFVERAAVARPGFAVTDRNAAAVAALCTRLDGLPLAIELAAARVRVLTPEQLTARLGDRFRLLTGGGRTALPRQQTLRATVDWSHDLLSEEERALFRRLAVFAGGFSLDAAEEVGAGEGLEPADVLDRLTGLVDKSLVVAEAHEAAEARGGEARYRLLETLRQYAEDKLLQAGEAAAVRDRHRDWCLALARRATREEGGPGALEWNARVRAETDNVRAALTWCASREDGAPRGMELIAVPSLFYEAFGHSDEYRWWLERFLRLVPARTPARARALLHLVTLLLWQHDFTRAEAAAAEAAAIFEEVGDAAGAAEARGTLGVVHGNLGDYARAHAHLEASLAAARTRSDQAQIIRFTRDIGLVCIAGRDFSSARAALTESARRAAQVGGRGGFPYSAVLPVLRLAILDRLEGDYAAARRGLEDVQRRLDQTGAAGSRVSDFWRDIAEAALGNLARAEGRFDTAQAILTEVARRAHQGQYGAPLAELWSMLGFLAIARGAAGRGVTLIAAGARGAGPIGTVHMPDVRAEAPGFLEHARQALGEPAFAAAWAQGQAMTPEQAFACALDEAPDAPDSWPSGPAPGMTSTEAPPTA